VRGGVPRSWLHRGAQSRQARCSGKDTATLGSSQPQTLARNSREEATIANARQFCIRYLCLFWKAKAAGTLEEFLGLCRCAQERHDADATRTLGSFGAVMFPDVSGQRALLLWALVVGGDDLDQARARAIVRSFDRQVFRSSGLSIVRSFNRQILSTTEEILLVSSSSTNVTSARSDGDNRCADGCD
jgi:hypothetical protein